MALRGGVVVVAGRTPDTVDRVATRLREDHTVRVAYPSTDLDARIDDYCDVLVLLDTDGVGPLPERTERLPQVGLVGDPAALGTTVDTTVPPPIDDVDVRSMVRRLAARARFCRALRAAYDEACHRVESQSPGGAPTVEQYRAEVNDVLAAITTAEAFELLGGPVDWD
ncbi:hypothetical protein [Halococcoides cellulosivorans]|uniref:Uncharacterized protein n=1 Tax=Halococcoides cellulosivorans TaxID=1679096 RepID=A0A2R4X130_9EURY|nr:hypothetical protein [Halococcoides cellulosivorans]AWB27481.1 hypothetical protein HARCEL1_07055 [Halococcoides cellulosivorans]